MKLLRLPLVVLLALLLPFGALASISARHCDETPQPSAAMTEHCADMQKHAQTMAHHESAQDAAATPVHGACSCAHGCASGGLPSVIAAAAATPIGIEAPQRAGVESPRAKAPSRPFRPPARA